MPSLVRYPLPQPRLLAPADRPRIIRAPAPGAPPEAPQTVTGLRLWLAADKIPAQTDNTAFTTAWVDASGLGNNAGPQATGTAQPLYRTAQINGLPALSFDGGDSLPITNANLLAATNAASGCTVFAVVARNSTALPPQQILSLSSGTSSGSSRVSLAARDSGAGAGPVTLSAAGRRLDADSLQFLYGATATSSTGQAALTTGVFDWANATATVYLNGTQDAQTTSFQTAGTVSATNSLAAAVGSLASGGAEFWIGLIAELIVYDRVLSAPDRQTVTDYLTAKYALAANTIASAQAATLPVTAADASVALGVDAGAGTAPVTAADGVAAAAPAAGAASVPAVAADAAPALAVNAGAAAITSTAADATVSTAAQTNANAEAATVGVAAAAATGSVEAQAASADLIAVAAVEAVDVTATIDAQAATVGVTAADATVSTTGTTNVNAQAATLVVAAADVSVALTVDAGAAAVPVPAADALEGVAPAAGAASVPVAAQDAATAITVDAAAASLPVTAVDATVSTASFSNADAGPASLLVTAADASSALSVTAGTASLPVTAADATVSAVAVTNADAGPATVGVVATDASSALSVTAEAASIPVAAGGPGWGIVAGTAALSVAAADASSAAAASAVAASVPITAAAAEAFIPPPVPPPRWVEGVTVATGTVEGVLVGAGIVEGGASL